MIISIEDGSVSTGMIFTFPKSINC